MTVKNAGMRNFFFEISEGELPGWSVVHKYGRNPNGANSTEDTVNDLGEMQFPTAASTMRIKAGGNAADDASGAGAREVTIQGVGASGEFISEAVATAGASASSSTTASFLRVFRAFVSASGTYATTGTGTGGTNQGAITIENTAGDTDFIRIAANEGQTQYAGYTIPADKTGYLKSATITVDSTKVADVLFYTRADITNTTAPVAARRLKLYFDGVAGLLSFKPETPIRLGSGMDTWWTFIPTANGTECAVDYEIILNDN